MRLLALVLAGFTSLVGVARAGELRVAVEGPYVTIEAREVRVERVLAEIGRRGGLEIDLEGSLVGSVTLDMERLPLVEALHRILRGHNFAVRHLDPSSRKLWVFDHALAEGARLTSKAPAPSRPNGDEMFVRRARRQEVAALIDAGTQEAIESLAALALSDVNAEIREEAVYGLGEVGGERGRQVLEQALRDTDRGVREAAIQTLADLGGEAAAWALAAALDDGDASLREDAVHALAEVGGEAVFPILRRALADAQPIVRDAAADVLDELSRQGL